MSIKETRWLAIPSPCSMLNSEAEGEAAAAASAQNPVHDARDGKVVRRNTLKVAHFLSDFRMQRQGRAVVRSGSQNGSQDPSAAFRTSQPSIHSSYDKSPRCLNSHCPVVWYVCNGEPLSHASRRERHLEQGAP